jgi:hypothetical protein
MVDAAVIVLKVALRDASTMAVPFTLYGAPAELAPTILIDPFPLMSPLPFTVNGVPSPFATWNATELPLDWDWTAPEKFPVANTTLAAVLMFCGRVSVTVPVWVDPLVPFASTWLAVPMIPETPLDPAEIQFHALPLNAASQLFVFDQETAPALKVSPVVAVGAPPV